MINYKFQTNYKIKIKQKACGEYIYIYIYNSIATRVSLKDITHMFYFQYHKLFKGGVSSRILTLKYMCHVGMSS